MIGHLENIENKLMEKVACHRNVSITNHIKDDLEGEDPGLQSVSSEVVKTSEMNGQPLQWPSDIHFGSSSKFFDAARTIHENTLRNINKQRIKKVQEMQDNVEDEIEEYKRRKDLVEKEEKEKMAEFNLLSNVKGVEFAIRMFLHQMDNENKDIEK